MKDYKKKLKDALDDKLVPVEVQEWIEETFPELAESEDERIRKEILEFFQQFDNKELHGVDISEWIAWLEKQGEKKLLNNKQYQTVSIVTLERLYDSEKELKQLKSLFYEQLKKL